MRKSKSELNLERAASDIADAVSRALRATLSDPALMEAFQSDDTAVSEAAAAVAHSKAALQTAIEAQKRHDDPCPCAQILGHFGAAIMADPDMLALIKVGDAGVLAALHDDFDRALMKMIAASTACEAYSDPE